MEFTTNITKSKGIRYSYIDYLEKARMLASLAKEELERTSDRTQWNSFGHHMRAV